MTEKDRKSFRSYQVLPDRRFKYEGEVPIFSDLRSVTSRSGSVHVRKDHPSRDYDLFLCFSVFHQELYSFGPFLVVPQQLANLSRSSGKVVFSNEQGLWGNFYILHRTTPKVEG